MALFSPPLHSWTVLLWVVLLCACFRLLCGAGFSTLLFLVLLAFSLPLVGGAVSPSPPFAVVQFFCLSLWVVLLALLPPFFCGAAFLRLLAVLLPFSSETELNTANTTKDEAKVNLFCFFLMINCCFFFVYLQLLFFFRFIFLLACWLLGRFMEGIQIKVDIPSGPRRPPNKPSKSRSPRPLPPPHTTPPTHTHSTPPSTPHTHSSPPPTTTTPSSLLPDTPRLSSRGRSFFGVIWRTWPARVVLGFQSLLLSWPSQKSSTISEHILVVSDNMLGLLRAVLKQEPQSPTCVSCV